MVSGKYYRFYVELRTGNEGDSFRDFETELQTSTIERSFGLRVPEISKPECNVLNSETHEGTDLTDLNPAG